MITYFVHRRQLVLYGEVRNLLSVKRSKGYLADERATRLDRGLKCRSKLGAASYFQRLKVSLERAPQPVLFEMNGTGCGFRLK
jgi:hypothetical protein